MTRLLIEIREKADGGLRVDVDGHKVQPSTEKEVQAVLAFGTLVTEATPRLMKELGAKEIDGQCWARSVKPGESK